MPLQTLSDPTLVFLRTVWALDHGLQSHSKRMKAQKGVTGPQRLVLRALELAPGMPPSELAKLLCFHKSTVSVIVRSLETDGFVDRSPNPTDGRAVVLRLTTKGRRTVEQREGTVEAVFRATLERLSDRDVRAAQRVLDALSRAFDRDGA